MHDNPVALTWGSAAQLVPQVPQLSMSVPIKSMQPPAQIVVPVEQPHLPPSHTSSLPHVTPQPLQLFGSVERSTQVPPQLVWTARQPFVHA